MSSAPTLLGRVRFVSGRPRLRGMASGAAPDYAVIGILLGWFVLVIAPIIILFVFSFFTTEYFQTIYDPSLETWSGLFSSGRFEVTLRTLRIALTVTLVELAVGFPFALWLAKGGVSKGQTAVLLSMLTIPFFLDMSSRTIVWRSILGQSGMINNGLLTLGVVDAPIDWLLYSEFAVHFGMIVSLFPPMVLPIYLAMRLIDDSMLEASKDLGASPFQTLVKIVIPLSLPGVVAGVIFTLGPALAAWVEPEMLGGGFVNMLSNSIESTYTALKYPTVAALSSFLIMLLFAIIVLLYFIANRFSSISSMARVFKGDQ